MFWKSFLSSSIIAYQNTGKNLHHLQWQVNIPGTNSRQYLMNRPSTEKICADTVGRIKMQRILSSLIHQHTVKFFFQKCMGNLALFCYLVYIGVTGRIQNIVASKSQHICHQCRIFFFPDPGHTFFKKFPCFFSMHLYSILCHRIFWYKIIKENIRAMLSDPIQISIAADQMLQFFRKFSANPFSKKIMCVSCGHFLFRLFCL